MKKLLLASAALAVLSFGGQAQAADMKVRYVAPPPAFSWTGCYAGVNAGYKWGYSQHTYAGLSGGALNTVLQGRGFVAGSDLTDSFSVNGALLGVDGGCQMQFGPLVAGVEADYDLSAASGQALSTAGAVTAGVSSFQIYQTTQRRLATVRGRAGYAMDKFLFFVSGGVAFGSFDLTNNLPVNLNPWAQQDPTRVNKTGWTVGAGADYALAGGWSVRAEYLYVDFGNSLHYGDYPAPCAPPTPAVLIGGGCPNADVRMYEHIGRVGLNYKFF